MTFRETVKAHQVKIVSALFLLIFGILLLAPSMFIYVYPGQAGVLFQALSNEPLDSPVHKEGLYFIAPWNQMYVYDVTRQKHSVDVGALTNNGLVVSMRISALFQPNSEQLITLATEYGPDYSEKIIVPTINSAVRHVIGDHTPEALYTSESSGLHAAILAESQERFAGLPFTVDDVIIENLVLPPAVNDAIEEKLRVQQGALAYTFLLEKQEAETKRLKIEAEGIRTYQEIVSSNLTPELLQWLQIRAMYDLAGSDNSKVIVIGDSEKLPLLLDGSAN